MLALRICRLYAPCVSIVGHKLHFRRHWQSHMQRDMMISTVGSLCFFAFSKQINVMLQVYEEADVNVERFLEHVRKWEEQEAAKAAKNQKQGGKPQAGTTQGDASKAVDAQAKA